MESKEFKKEYKVLMDLANDYLKDVIENFNRYPETIFNAMEYSLFAGGKRLRPVLLLATHRLLGGNIEESLPYAGAMEMIHTYSLIHDDLPAMDNDDFRRGKATNHRVFGEGIAVLAGDALLNLAYETMIENASLYPQKAINHLKAIEVIANSAGVRGMIGGQVVDLEGEGKAIDEKTLEYIHHHKTGALFMASIKAGIELESPSEARADALLAYGEALGLAFQVMDDILDEIGDDDTLGKSTGRDKDKGKATYVDLYGLDTSQSIARNLSKKAVDHLKIFGSEADFLRELARFFVYRHN